MKTILKTVAAVALAACSLLAAAQAYPDRAVRLIVPFPPGGGTDIIARPIAQKLAEKWGQPVVIDNRGGAGGNVGTKAAAEAPPDGYTLILGVQGTHAVNQSLYAHAGFDSTRDFAAITMVANTPNILVVHPSVPARSVAELIALAKAKPGQLNFAIGGIGSSLHMAGDAFKMQSGTFIVNIPYRGTAPAVQDVLAGQVQLMFAAVGNVQAHIKAGKLKALGVTTTKRLPSLPEVPAIAETLPGYESSAWFGLFGPAGLPQELAKRISDAARQAIAQPEMRRRLETEGAIPVGNAPEQFSAFVQSEIVRWGKVVKFSGAKPE
jgi:tripartite-type tricarboxylate transporter receptor subunit TctC